MADEELETGIELEYSMTEDGDPVQTIVVRDNAAMRKLVGVSMGFMTAKLQDDTDAGEFPTMMLTHIPLEHEHDEEGNCLTAELEDEDIQRGVYIVTRETVKEMVSGGIHMLFGGDDEAAHAILSMISKVMELKHNIEEHGSPEGPCDCPDD